jgi:hypothetical protein
MMSSNKSYSEPKKINSNKIFMKISSADLNGYYMNRSG